MWDRPRAEDPYKKLPALPAFSLTSTDISDGEPMPAKCAGFGAVPDAANLSPQLSWHGFPSEAKSFTVSCFDADAPTPSGCWHWILVDIPASVTSLETGAALPGSAQALTSDIGVTHYMGPMPPEGDFAHRYYFVVHAVAETSLGVDATASGAVVSFNLLHKAVARAQIIGTFQR